MSWRREVEAVVGAPTGFPAVVVTFAGGVVRWRLVERGAGLFPLVARRCRRTVAPPRRAPRSPGNGAERRVAGDFRATPGALPLRDGSIAWLAASFLGELGESSCRRALFAEVARVLVPGAALVIVDHNRPRRFPATVAALALPPRPPGSTPAAVWRRLAYPSAREVRGAGFTVDRLRLAVAERVQVVVARRAARAVPST